jgi:hypothetical protein
MSITFKALAMGLIGAVLLSGTSAFANNSCILDLENFCGGVDPGNLRVFNCMVGNADSLSPGCKNMVMQTSAQLQTVRTNCAVDVQRFCADQPAGNTDDAISCLQDWTDQITPDCLTSWNRLQALPYQPDF